MLHMLRKVQGYGEEYRDMGKKVQGYGEEYRDMGKTSCERCRTDARMLRRETVQSEQFFANLGS